MEDNKKPYVIAIAAVSGGGKTTITIELLNQLENSKALYFDNYEFDKVPEDICEWVENGSDCNEWVLTPLIEDLKNLINERSFNYILLDYPFAYEHSETRGFIDFTIFIDTPLDIAMARRILRDHHDNSEESIRAEMKHYLFRARNAYLNMLDTIKPKCDVIVDGSLPIRDIVQILLDEIKK